MCRLSEVEDKIRDNVKCCACGGSLKSSKHINGVCLNKLATWEYPCWGNILIWRVDPEKGRMKRATAILCDSCIKDCREPKYAVEWNRDYSEVKYHRVEDLKDLPEISEKDVREAEARLYDFGVGG